MTDADSTPSWNTRVAAAASISAVWFLSLLARFSTRAQEWVLKKKFKRGDLRAAARFAERYCDPESAQVQRVLDCRDVFDHGVPAPPGTKGAPLPGNKNVLIALHQSLPHRRNGYAIRSHHILESLRSHGVNVLGVTRLGFPLDQGYDLPHDTLEETVDGVRYMRIPPGRTQFQRSSNSSYITEYSEALARVIEKHDCSVVHGASDFMNGMGAALAAHLTGAKSIYEVRGLWHLSQAAKNAAFADTGRYTYMEQMELATMRRADEVVVISEALRDYVQERGISAERITVVPNAVNVDRFAPVPKDGALARELGVEDKFVIGFLGSLNGYEGIDYLIEATRLLVREGAGVVTLVVGEGRQRKGLEALVRSKGLQRDVRFIGHVSFDQVQRYYSIFDVCPFPRSSQRVTRVVPPLKILEAMAMEKPVIVSELAPLLEMVSPGMTGLAAKPNDAASLCDALRATYEDANLRQTLGKAGREWVCRERSWKKVSERFLPLYSPSPNA